MNTPRRFYTGLLSLLTLISTCFTADAYTIYSYGGDENNRRPSPYTADTYDYLYREKGVDYRSLRAEGGAGNPFNVGFGRWGGWSIGFDTLATPGGDTKDRAEIEMAPAYPNRPGIPFGKQFYTGFSMNIPNGFPAPTNWFVAVQWWQDGTVSPPMAMNLKSTSSTTTIPYRFEGYHGTTTNPVYVDAGTSGLTGNLERNRWYDFVVQYNFNSTSNGYIQLWQDIAKAGHLAYKGIHYSRIGYSNSQQRVNQKFGIYRGATNVRHILYFDEFAVATEYGNARPGTNKTISPVAHLNFDNNITNYGHGGGGTSLVRGASYSNDSRKGTQSVNFNANQQQYVHLASGGTSFYNEEGFNHTVSLWIKPDRVNGTQVIYDRSDTSFGFLMRLVGNVIEGSMKTYRPGSSGGIFKVSAAGVPVNTWTHVAITYEPGFLRMYINGSLRTSTTIPADHSDFVISQGGAVLGGRVSGAIEGGGGSGNYYDGKIDDVFIYNQTLTESEIYNLVHR